MIEIRKLKAFDKVKFSGPGTLTIIQCDETVLTIDAPERFINNIKSAVVDETLRLVYQNSQVISLGAYREKINYELRVRDLKDIKFNGNGRVNIVDLDNDFLNLSLAGSGEISVAQLTADHLSAKLTGSGQIKVVGDVEMQNLTITGSGSFIAEGLVSDFADVNVSGSGNAIVSVSEELNVKITGSGQVTYTGYPGIEKLISGSGKLVRQRRDNKRVNKEKNHG